MATLISTSSTADATATSGAPLVVAAPSDATINALYFDDGTGGPHLATAASPYTSWATQAIGSATHRNSQALATLSNDNLDLWVTSPANGPAYFTAARSGGAWSPAFSALFDGSFEANNTGVGAGGWIGIDPQGRVWALGLDDVLATYQVWCDYLSGGTWASGGAAIEGLNLGEQNHRGVCAAIIGNYLVVVYDSGGGALKYLRIDVHAATLGAWSSAVAVGSISDVTTASVLALCAIPGGSTGMLVYSGGNGLSALAYDAGADTWGSPTVLSASTSDRHPTLIPGASGIVYAVWCEFAAANSYALVGRGYNGGTWHTKATLEASGNNIAWPNGTLLSGPDLALIWTQGTGAPYSVEFDAVAAPSTGGSVSGGGSLVANGVLSVPDAQVVAGAATLASNSGLAAPAAQVNGAGALASNSALSVAAAQVVATGDVLQANAALQGFALQPAAIGTVTLAATLVGSATLSAAGLGTVALSAAVTES